METITVQTRPQPWFRNWFDTSFYHQLYGHRDEKEAAGFIDALLAELQPSKDTRMLDLACGAGRHAKYLASKGFDVTGIDLSPSSIRMARKNASPKLQFYQHDMLMSFGTGKFDFIFNFFTSFGYFKSMEENLLVMNNISTCLKRHGSVVIDYLNVPYSEQCLIPKEEKEIDGIQYHLTRWMDEKHFFKQIEIDNGSSTKPLVFREQVAKLRLPDFEYLFEQNGLLLQNVYGDYQLNKYHGA